MGVIVMDIANMIFVLYQLEDLKVKNELSKAKELVERELTKLEKEC